MDSKIQSSTEKCVFLYRQSNVWWLLPASDHCRVGCNEIVEHSSVNKREFGCGRKPGGAAEHLIDSSEKRICQLWIEFLSLHVIEIRSNKSLLLYQDYSVIL